MVNGVKRFEEIELPAKLLNYRGSFKFLKKSEMDSYLWMPEFSTKKHE